MSQKIVPYAKHGIKWDSALIGHLERNRSKPDEPGLLVDLEPYALRLYLLIQIRVADEWKTSAEALEVEIANSDAYKFAGLDDEYLPKARRLLAGHGLVSYAPADDRKAPRVYRYRLFNPLALRTSWGQKHPAKTGQGKNTRLKPANTPG